MSVDSPTPDGTLRIPRPGGAAGSPSPRRTRRPVATAVEGPAAAAPSLLGAAAVLLALPERLRASLRHPDPAGLRQRLLEQVARFEADCATAGVERSVVQQARFVLCCFIDEAIAGTPWGASSADRPLLAEFHDERDPGAKAFELLDRLGTDPAGNAALIELFYRCLRLGFEGGWRGHPHARAQLDTLADRLLETLRPGAPAAPSLALNAEAVVRRRQDDRPLLPAWLLPVLAAGALVALLVALKVHGDALTHPLLQRLHGLVQPLRLDPPAAAAAARPRLVPLLQADVSAGRLSVRDEALRSWISLPADGLFEAGSTRWKAGSAALLERVARALHDLPGQVALVGHTDESGGLRSLDFPSAWHLSFAQARAVQDRLIAAGLPAQRLRAEGRADAEPLAAGEPARNRRIDIELQLPRPQP